MKHPLLVSPCSIPQFFQMVGENLLDRLESLPLLKPTQILEISQGTVQHRLRQYYPTACFTSFPLGTPWLEEIPYPDESLDLILSNLALPWFSHAELLVQEFARVLKPGGTLLFSTLGTETLKELYQAASIATQPFVDMHDLGDLLVQVGLTHPVVDVEWFEIHCMRIREILRELKLYQAYPKELVQKNRLKTLFTTYEQYRSPEGYLPVSVEVIYGYATGKKEKTYEKLIPL